MRLISLAVKNYRSIVDSGEVRIEPLQAFVGENNAGKSNLLYALQAFLTAGAGGVEETDFFDATKPIIVTATFGQLAADERKRLRPYLLADRLILQKDITLEPDKKTGKVKASTEYHGYVARPKDWWLSVEGVIEHEETDKPKWPKIGEDHGILDYVRDPSGRVNKQSYEAGLRRLLLGREDIEYEEPQLGQTQALGLQPVLLESLPRFYLLPAITDYSDEIQKQSTTTNFRRLMADLADRILRFDPRFQQIEATLASVKALLNPPAEGEHREEGQERLAVLGHVEERLQELIAKLMPSVRRVCFEVTVEETREMFSRGVAISVDDGRLTEVLSKGHGLQRCVVFGLLQALILNQRGQLVTGPQDEGDASAETQRPIILAIEEPELYIHPQAQRLVYAVLRDFAETDQVLYTTHCPAFVDVGAYHAIGVVRKDSVETGTRLCQCEAGVLDADTERKTFQFLSSFGLEQNQMFFAKKVVLVEGPQDVIAVVATGRHLRLFAEFPEELGCTIVTASKEEMPKFIKLLNAFGIPYGVLHELDGDPGSQDNEAIRRLVKEGASVELSRRLEDAVGHKGHFQRAYHAKRWFEDPAHITPEIQQVVQELFK